MLQAWRACVSQGLLLTVILCWALVLTNLYAQSTTTMVDWLDRRVSVIESQNIDGRLRVLESDMSELKWLSRSVAAAMIGQFAISGMSLLRRNRGGG